MSLLYTLLGRPSPARRLDPYQLGAPLVIVPIEGWNRLTEEAPRFGMRLSPDVVAVHVLTGESPVPFAANDPRPLCLDEQRPLTGLPSATRHPTPTSAPGETGHTPPLTGSLQNG